ncbi:MAG: hypothetical protein ACR2MD_07785 [Aridibacter sp.]
MFAHFKKLSLVFVILFISVIYTSNTFAQCSCSGKYRDITASKELELADAVFVGKVIEVHKTEPDKRNRYTETVRLEVKEFWKGELAETFTLVNEIYGCINGYDANEVFLIYAYKNKNGTYSTGCCCSRTTILSKADKDLKEFEESGLKAEKIIDNETSQNTQEEIAYYKTVFPPTMEKMTKADANVRKFVWEHWRNNRNGTVTREGINKHGEKYVANYKVKCFEDKNCQIFVKIERENAGRGGVKADKPIKQIEFIVDSVDRVKNPTNYYSNGEVNIISDDAEIRADLYFVRLKDENGKTISLL